MSFSDDSDLTELSSGDDDDTPLAASSTRGLRKKAVINPALRAPRTVSYSVESLYRKLYDNTLDLDPEYQRDVVWPDAKQTQLIDSLIHNYYIPPLIFAVSISSEGEEKRTCIDGKQRLSSIQRFMDGHIMHKDSVNGGKFWYTACAGKTSSRTLLPPQLKSRFSNKQITCVEYDDLTHDQEREIFRRVQLGVALTPAERLQAINGSYPMLIREVKERLSSPSGLEGYLPWGNSRGRDFMCLAQIVYLIDFGESKTEPSTTKIEAWLSDKRNVTPKLQRNVDNTIDVLCELAQDPVLSKPFKTPKVSPVEFVMIAYMIFLYRDQLSMRQLSDAVDQMRKSVRSDFQEIRFNTKVYKNMLAFVQRMKKMTFKSDGKGDRPASEVAKSVPRVKVQEDVVMEDLPRKTTTPKGKQKAEPTKARKRRRVVDDSDSEEWTGSKNYSTKGKTKSASTKTNAAKSTSGRVASSTTRTTTNSKAAVASALSTADHASPIPKGGTPVPTLPKARTATKPKVSTISTDVSSSLPQTATPRIKTLNSATTLNGSPILPPSLSRSTPKTPMAPLPKINKIQKAAEVEELSSSLSNTSLSTPVPTPTLPSAPAPAPVNIQAAPPPTSVPSPVIRVKEEPRDDGPSLWSSSTFSGMGTQANPIGLDLLAPMRAAKARLEASARTRDPRLNNPQPPPNPTPNPNPVNGIPIPSMNGGGIPIPIPIPMSFQSNANGFSAPVPWDMGRYPGPPPTSAGSSSGFPPPPSSVTSSTFDAPIERRYSGYSSNHNSDSPTSHVKREPDDRDRRTSHSGRGRDRGYDYQSQRGRSRSRSRSQSRERNRRRSRSPSPRYAHSRNGIKPLPPQDYRFESRGRGWGRGRGRGRGGWRGSSNSYGGS
ncbi:uncharacterized protein EV420DRAFT_1534249 [Desarmillaria tabescens]|uniref:GmrSD restriction endonucleases N-terminal domain-containing protein n=1 Tax=Armillaria tabescens TaxID=1929756 RepID=A0AA39N6I8_ARMTA|nr:uncharacterized protein EV420DRAFT_1534249 [Desarmillaria tabescens]KAK0459976.1 hypothetical protein EV420DRAFT_1534249 [Desarmillaria tabescens]